MSKTGERERQNPRRFGSHPALVIKAGSETDNGARERLYADRTVEKMRPMAAELNRRVIGQEQALDMLVSSFSRSLSGLRDPARPLLTALLMGPTGVGKTETARSLASVLFRSDRAMTRVNCEEYSHGHEISKLLGSPPGYVGFNVEPLLTQARLEEPHRRLRRTAAEEESETVRGLVDDILSLDADEHVSIVLFDEIEKADPRVWSALLGILEDGSLTLGDNSTTDFTRSVILMTSNVGSIEMDEFLSRRPMGFGAPEAAAQAVEEDGAAPLSEVAMAAARARFPLEFLNRFDETLVYEALAPEDLEQIFDKFLAEVHERALNQAGVPLLLVPSPEARAWVIERGADLRFGARPLRRSVERELVDPLSRFIAGQQLEAGDVVEVEVEDGRLAFFRRSRELREIVA